MELKVIFLNGTRSNKSVSFSRVGFINLGNKDDNDLVLKLPEDTLVAGYHAQIRQVEDKIFIQDMGSKNGTFLNGQKITKTQLSNSDTVQLGMGGPKFEVESNPSAPRMSFFTQSNASKKEYGQRTVGMMIQQALKNAGNGMSRSTAYFEAILEKKLSTSTKKYKIAMLSVFILLIIFGIVLGVYIYKTDRLPSIKLLSNESDAAEKIASENKYNIFLLAGLPKSAPPDSDAYEGFCSAFSIGPNILATNAHCVTKADKEYQSIWALMNEAPKNRYLVDKMLPHGKYVPNSITPDVGLLKINGVLRDYVKMATNDELTELELGSFIYVYGFPGSLSSLAEPIATFVRGEIGRITTLEHSVGSYAQNVLLQHSAVISEGTSGSPMFNLDGQVVGVNAGGYASEGRMLTGYNFGMRIDLIYPLLRQFDQ